MTEKKKAPKEVKKSGSQLDYGSESDCECPICGEHYGDRSATWIQCSMCEEWYDADCAGFESANEVPETYACKSCVS